MKANKVIETLQITRRTLSTYVKDGKIRVKKLDNGFYEYEDEDVKQLEKNVSNKNLVVIYIDGRKLQFKLKKDEIEKVIDECVNFLKS